MKLRERFRKSLFLKTFNLVKKQPKLIFYTLVFDFLFVSSLYGISALLKIIMPEVSVSLDISKMKLFSFMLLSIVVYPVFVVLTYSFFKYVILNFIKSFVKEEDLSFNRFWGFYLMNVVIFAVIFLIIIAINLLLTGVVRQEAAAFVFIFIFAVAMLLSYSLINISHSMFIEGIKTKDILNKSYKLIFTRIPAYLPVFLLSLAFFILFNILFYIIMLPFRSVTLKYALTYQAVFSVISYIVFYAIFLFNRVYFYLITKEKLM